MADIAGGGASDPADLDAHWCGDPDALPTWLHDALATPRERLAVRHDGIDLNAFRWGDPARPGLILTHGFLSHARSFAFIAPFLANDFHVVAFDHAGMGDSGHRDGYSEASRVADLLAVAEETGLFAEGRRPTIVAHSFGASIGLRTAELHADRFSGLIVCDLMVLRPERLQAHFEGGGRRPGPRDPTRPNRVYPDYETARERYVLSPPQPVGVPLLMDYMAFHSMERHEGGWRWKFDPGVTAPSGPRDEQLSSLGPRLVALDATGFPLSIVHGEDSVLFDRDSAAYLRELGGTMPIIGIPEAAHHLMLDQPIAFVTALRTVLAHLKT
ncbi:MAG: alpha/beta hydrolase [Pseudomonadota bacterium]